ncbi:hypothetical protein [Rhizobium sp. BE258]|uniref:hypothetical protein n=1 Tax=Rhizobium sp. BE258 TaxID=2817722 RepID=UPI0028632224|nr:hypothetical protein [Rhizobium sp. BE258]MDR7148033.1 hypothetical protein [Rhizobium sp. BE258]
MTFPHALLDQLPLFASDDEIAVAIVGKAKATSWKRGALKVMEARGFPKVDALHGGRPVPLIKKWYASYMLLDRSYIPSTLEDPRDNMDALRPKQERRADRKPKLNIDTRCQTVLRHMIANPSESTVHDLKGVGEVTLKKIESHGVIEVNGTDAQKNSLWAVTDLGRQEIKRIDYCFTESRTHDRPTSA